MPLSLPNLDDLRWRDLTEEARSLIPATAPEWTNFNPTDPGITLIEMLAFVSETLMYQLNRISDKSVLEFLMLINGVEWKQEKERLERKAPLERQKELLEQKRSAAQLVDRPCRAVTAADFERLACGVANVSRAKCIPGRNLESEEADSQVTQAPGHISVVILTGAGKAPTRELRLQVRQALEPARLLTTRLHVVGPRYVKLRVQVAIVPRRGANPEAVREEATERIRRFFDPLNGGFEGKGWPLGRNAFVSDIYQILSDLPDIDAVTPARDSTGATRDELVLAWPEASRLKRNPQGEFDAIELRRDELVEVEIGGNDIVIASRP